MLTMQKFGENATIAGSAEQNPRDVPEVQRIRNSRLSGTGSVGYRGGKAVALTTPTPAQGQSLTGWTLTMPDHNPSIARLDLPDERMKLLDQKRHRILIRSCGRHAIAADRLISLVWWT